MTYYALGSVMEETRTMRRQHPVAYGDRINTTFTPEQRLCLAMISRACLDIVNSDPRLREDAWRWFGEKHGPDVWYSCAYCCVQTKIDLHILRKLVLKLKQARDRRAQIIEFGEESLNDAITEVSFPGASEAQILPQSLLAALDASYTITANGELCVRTGPLNGHHLGEDE